jgi:hypothetical protein
VLPGAFVGSERTAPTYISDYVAELQCNREFPSPSGNRQLAYKFPKWMKLAKNRDEILRVIERLRAKT